MKNIHLSESIALKTVSLILALILWITILGLKREEIKKNVKFEPLIPPGKALVNKIPSSIQFTFSGPRVLLRNFEKKIDPIRPDFTSLYEKAFVYTVSDEAFGALPNGIRITSFHPTTILLQLEDLIEKEITVKPILTGKPYPGEEILSIVSIPKKVVVNGPNSIIQIMETISTEPIDINGIKGKKTFTGVIEVEKQQNIQLTREKFVKVIIITHKSH